MIRVLSVIWLVVVMGAGIAHGQQSNASAQGVAEIQARSCAMRHHGGNSGYEGVGMSSVSAEDALARCCFSRSGMAVVDQGVARGTDGNWYACKRYRGAVSAALVSPGGHTRSRRLFRR